MKRICSLLLALALVLGLCACAQKAETSAADTPTWQEQYDLGVKYLSEGNYEEAIIAFTAAIEIDPNRVEAYIGRGDAYAATGDADNARVDYEKARELGGDQAILEKRLSELSSPAQLDNMPQDTVENGGLDITSLTYRYDAGTVETGGVSADGEMVLKFTVNGPDSVRDVVACSWGEPGSFDVENVKTNVIGRWRGGVVGVWDWAGDSVPYDMETSFPVYSKDHGTRVDVLLVGLDETMDAVDFKIVEVVIP